jgi:hypothetical protein
MNLASPLVGINQSVPIAQLHVKTSGDAIPGNIWDSTWMVVTSAPNSATTYNTPGLGFGYSVACNTAYIAAIEPNVRWRELKISACNILLSPEASGGGGGFVGIGMTAPARRLDVIGSTTYSPASGSTARLTTPVASGYDRFNLPTSTFNGRSGIQMASMQLTYNSLDTYGGNIAGGIQQNQGPILSLGLMDDSVNVNEIMRATPINTWFPAPGGVQITGRNGLNVQVPGSIFNPGTAAGSNGYIATATLSNISTAFGSSNFTIELWAYPTYTSAYSELAIFSAGVPGTSEIRIAQSVIASNTPGFVIGTTKVQGTANAIVSNTWYHMALVRNGNAFTLYINGVSNAGSNIAGFTFANAGYILMGTFNGGANYYTGFIGNVRITNGNALYTGSSFSVPVGALQFVAGTSLLMNMFTSATATTDSANRVDINLTNGAAWSMFSPSSNTSSFPLVTFGSVGNMTQTVYYNTGNPNTGSATRRLDFNGISDYLLITASGTLSASSTFGTYITASGIDLNSTNSTTTFRSSNQNWIFTNTSNSSNVAVITGSGNMGVGTDSPEFRMDIRGQTRIYEGTGTTPTATSGSLIIQHGNANGQSSIVFPSAINSGSDRGYIIYQDDVSNSGERSRLLIGTGDDTGGVSSVQDAVILMPSGGFVGIGESNPVTTLDVNGNQQVKANGSSSTSVYGATNDTLTLRSTCNAYGGGIASIYFGINTDNYPLARIYAQDASGGGTYQGRLVFQTNNAGTTLVERMRIEAGGNVGIGTNAPAYKLDVTGTIRATAGLVFGVQAV